MSALPQALPLALSAAIYPPVLLVLVQLMAGQDARRLTLAFAGGAALIVFGAGVIALVALLGAQLTLPDSREASGGVDILLGLLLYGVAAWAWRRRTRGPSTSPAAGRIAEWSRRATTSPRWAFVLGVALYLPSPIYLLAVKNVADSSDSNPSKLAAVVICGMGVMVFSEVALVALFVEPGGVASRLERFSRWLSRNGWGVTAALAFVLGTYATLKGIAAIGP